MTRTNSELSPNMRSVIYDRYGGPEVLTLITREAVEPSTGEVRVRIVVSAVNPTDWKFRQDRGDGSKPDAPTVPNQDGAGVVDAVGPDVTGLSVGDRVWLILAGNYRPDSGTAQEYTVVPAHKVVRLPDGVGFDEGASMGIPALTAHRALTVAEDGPTRLSPDALDGKIVLVAGGAGAVGNSAIQLARWAGATVITTVSTDAKADLARAAGAHHVVRYTDDDLVANIKQIAPDGVDVIVEVAAGANAPLDSQVVRNRGTIAIYGDDRGTGTLSLDLWSAIMNNVRYQHLVLYTVGTDKLRAAAEDVTAALASGGLAIGADKGLPIHRYPLDQTAHAHQAAEDGTVGKILIDVTPAE
jgi:NADPH2:quinone reductase